MSMLVVQERNLWLCLADMKEQEKVQFLNAPVSKTGLFGDAVESFAQQFFGSTKADWSDQTCQAPEETCCFHPASLQLPQLPCSSSSSLPPGRTPSLSRGAGWRIFSLVLFLFYCWPSSQQYPKLQKKRVVSSVSGSQEEEIGASQKHFPPRLSPAVSSGLPSILSLMEFWFLVAVASGLLSWGHFHFQWYNRLNCTDAI